MSLKEPSQLTDEELLHEVNKAKSSRIMDAFFFGFLIGIILYSVAINSWGFLSLIPLFLIYLFLKKSKRNEALKKEIKARNLQ
jgi:hypothetical protein